MKLPGNPGRTPVRERIQEIGASSPLPSPPFAEERGKYLGRFTRGGAR